MTNTFLLFIRFFVYTMFIAVSGVAIASAQMVEPDPLALPLIYQSFYTTAKSPVKPTAPAGKWINVNLDNKSISMMTGTNTLRTLPVLAAGKPKSESQTLGGMYRIPYKSTSHKSTLTPVYLPYALQIFGNYFIHGVPTDLNGVAQLAAYSAGCIRLSTPDAKILYDFADKLTPIIIEGNIQRGTNFYLKDLTTSSIKSAEFSVYDITNNADIYTRGFSGATSSAYTTRILPALVSFDVHNQDAYVRNPKTGLRVKHLELLDDFVKYGDLAIYNNLIKPHKPQEFNNLLARKMKALALASSTLATSPLLVTSPITDEMKVLAYVASYKPYLVTGDVIDTDGDSHIIREVKTKNGTTTLGIVLRKSHSPEADVMFIVSDISNQ